MGLSDVWARTLVYFGIAEEEDWDEDGYLTEDDLADPYERENVRRFPRRSRRDYDDDWTDPEPDDLQRTSILRPRAGAGAEPGGGPRAGNVARPPDPAAQLQRRPAGRRPLQGRRPRDPQPAVGRRRAVEAPDRLRQRPHLCPRRGHAAHRRQGLPAHAARRRALGRGPGADAR